MTVNRMTVKREMGFSKTPALPSTSHFRSVLKWPSFIIRTCSFVFKVNMSNSVLYLKAGYPSSVLANGVARTICQLQRITLKFCKSHGGSRGVREFIENDLVNFANDNPNIVFYVKPRRHRSPVFVAEYLNGEKKWMSLHCFTRAQVNEWLNLLKTQSGIPELRIIKPWRTANPSIQGVWNPSLFKNQEFNCVKFPNNKFSLPKNISPTATEILLEMVKNQKSCESINSNNNNNDDDDNKKMSSAKFKTNMESKLEVTV